MLPSLSETFGLVILAAWAAGAPVIATPTTGAKELIVHRENGWLFDLADAASFHACVDEALLEQDLAKQLAEVGRRRVATEFDCAMLAGRMKQFLQRRVDWRMSCGHATRNNPR